MLAKILNKNQTFFGTCMRTLCSTPKGDWIGPPDKQSNLRPIRFYKPPNENERQRALRLLKEDTQNWNQDFWSKHNNNFKMQKKEFEKTHQTSVPSEDNTPNLSSEEMAVFYKKFLDENYKLHHEYNKIESLDSNFYLLDTACQMELAKGVVDKITQVMMHYSEVEMQVREATNDDAWGPTGAMLNKLAMYTHNKDTYVDTMYMLWKRMLHEGKTNYRKIHKSLVILTYLLKHGSKRVVASSTDRLYDIKMLGDLPSTNDLAREQISNIKIRVKEIVGLLENKKKLEVERVKAQKNLKKIMGFSADISGDDSWVDERKKGMFPDRNYDRTTDVDWRANDYRDDDDDDYDDDNDDKAGANDDDAFGTNDDDVDNDDVIDFDGDDGVTEDYSKSAKNVKGYSVHRDEALKKETRRSYSIDCNNNNQVAKKGYKDYPNKTEFRDDADDDGDAGKKYDFKDDDDDDCGDDDDDCGDDDDKIVSVRGVKSVGGADDDDSFNPRKYEKSPSKGVKLERGDPVRKMKSLHLDFQSYDDVIKSNSDDTNKNLTAPAEFGDFSKFETITQPAELEDDPFDPLKQHSSNKTSVTSLLENFQTTPTSVQQPQMQQPQLQQPQLQQPQMHQPQLQQPQLQQPQMQQQQLQQQPQLQFQQLSFQRQPMLQQHSLQQPTFYQQQQQLSYNRTLSYPSQQTSLTSPPIFHSPPVFSSLQPSFLPQNNNQTFLIQQKMQLQQQAQLQQQQATFYNTIGQQMSYNQSIPNNFNDNSRSLI